MEQEYTGSLLDAFNEGARADDDDLNPYHHGSDLYDAWDDGWVSNHEAGRAVTRSKTQMNLGTIQAARIEAMGEAVQPEDRATREREIYRELRQLVEAKYVSLERYGKALDKAVDVDRNLDVGAALNLASVQKNVLRSLEMLASDIARLERETKP